MTSSSLRIRINGAGPTGSLLAYGLAINGYHVDLFDPLSFEIISSRSRAYALSHSSRRLLSRLGLWNSLKPYLFPFNVLRLEDRAINTHVRFTESDLLASNQSSGSIGWIVDHGSLMNLLTERLNTCELVSLHLGNSCSINSRDSDYSLIVAADGPRSATRSNLLIPFWSHRYTQGCLTAKVRFRAIDSNVAYECFRPEGPLALLPLGRNDFQVVWSAPLQRCKQLATLDTVEFLDQLSAILPCHLEADALLDVPAAFPLELGVAPRLHRGKVLLVGESGHRCHPVGGQGLNLCWRDVDTLLGLVTTSSALHRDLKHIPSLYSSRRFFDLLSVGVATDLLVRLFSNRQVALLQLRKLSLWLLRRVPLFRQLSLQAMTDGPGTLLHSLPE